MQETEDPRTNFDFVMNATYKRHMTFDQLHKNVHGILTAALESEYTDLESIAFHHTGKYDVIETLDEIKNNGKQISDYLIDWHDEITAAHKLTDEQRIEQYMAIKQNMLRFDTKVEDIIFHFQMAVDEFKDLIIKYLHKQATTLE